jgi:hypothetical protein
MGTWGVLRGTTGITWTIRTANAPWAGRYSHTTVVDATGAIYVIGGSSGGTTDFNDVWASTDGGARPDSVKGGRRRVCACMREHVRVCARAMSVCGCVCAHLRCVRARVFVRVHVLL